MITILDKVKRLLLVVAIFSFIYVALKYKSNRKHNYFNNIQKLVYDINIADRASYRINAEINDIESNKINNDALQSIYLRYGTGLITESEFLWELKKGAERAHKVYLNSLKRNAACSNYIRYNIILAKAYLARQWKVSSTSAQHKVSKAKTSSDLYSTKRLYLEIAVKWFGGKHKCCT